jgi:WD40 repeat protein
MRGGKSPVIALAYAPDGRTIAAGSADGSIRLWSPTSGRLLRILRGPKVGLQALDFSPAGDLLATAWKDGTVRLSDTQRWRTIELLPVGSTPVSLAFRPDGRFVSVGTSDGSVITWSAIVGKGREIE